MYITVAAPYSLIELFVLFGKISWFRGFIRALPGYLLRFYFRSWIYREMSTTIDFQTLGKLAFVDEINGIGREYGFSKRTNPIALAPWRAPTYIE